MNRNKPEEDIKNLGEMNSFFKTNGAQEDIIKDIINNFGESFITDEIQNDDGQNDHFRNYVVSMENNTIPTNHVKKLR